MDISDRIELLAKLCVVEAQGHMYEHPMWLGL